MLSFQECWAANAIDPNTPVSGVNPKVKFGEITIPLYPAAEKEGRVITLRKFCQAYGICLPSSERLKSLGVVTTPACKSFGRYLSFCLDAPNAIKLLSFYQKDVNKEFLTFFEEVIFPQLAQ